MCDLTRDPAFSAPQLCKIQPHLDSVAVHGAHLLVLPRFLFQGKGLTAVSDGQISGWGGGVPKFKRILRNIWQKNSFILFLDL